MAEVFLDGFLDALKLLPFLFVLYILIELLEHRTAMGKPGKAITGRFAPLIGGAAGLVPMCGFSVMAGKLYQKKYLTVGTLFAVFIATSDEALIVLALSSLPVAEKIYTILALLGSKFVLAAGVGYLIDAVAKKFRPQLAPAEGMQEEHGNEHGDEHGDGHVDELSVCEHKHASKWTLYLFSPLLHALEIAAIVFVFNLAFGLLFYWIGQEKVVGFLQGAGYWYQPLFTALVGLIPNCASSVALAGAYAIGGIGFGSLLGGLITNAGFGVFVLFREGRAWKRNLLILGATFFLGVLFGYAAGTIEFFI